MASVQWKRIRRSLTLFPFYFLVAQIAAQTSDPCGALPSASRFAFQSSYTPGVSVEYQCVSGYVQQSGDAQLTCNGTQWQGELLQCRSEHHGNTSHAKRCWQCTLARTVVWWWRLLYRVPKQSSGWCLGVTHWQFQTRANPGITRVNCAYCLPRKLGCDIAAPPRVSPARVTWQIWKLPLVQSLISSSSS